MVRKYFLASDPDLTSNKQPSILDKDWKLNSDMNGSGSLLWHEKDELHMKTKNRQYYEYKDDESMESFQWDPHHEQHCGKRCHNRNCLIPAENTLYIAVNVRTRDSRITGKKHNVLSCCLIAELHLYDSVVTFVTLVYKVFAVSQYMDIFTCKMW